jgi:hypothetical protein
LAATGYKIQASKLLTLVANVELAADVEFSVELKKFGLTQLE